MKPLDVDVAVIGSGFAGSLAALALARRGRRVALLERGRHPRFGIGESSTPLANVLLEELADRYDLPEVRPFVKWGTWQATRPDVAGGLKRGFAFFFHRPGEVFGADEGRADSLLVAASAADAVGDTHWYRQDFDRHLAETAQAAGCLYFDETRLERVRFTPTRMVLEGERGGAPVHVAARFVLDASGPRGCLHHLLALDEEPCRWLPPTEGVYTHFTDVARWDAVAAPAEAPPFPADSAALHHVFAGGWIWVLRFNNGITSAGAALTRAAAAGLGGSDAATRWEHLVAGLPSVGEQFRRARPVRPFVHVPRLAFRSHQTCGDRWALVPSAAGLIDPLLSTGIPLALLGLHRLLTMIESGETDQERTIQLEAYDRVTRQELDATEQMVAALYGSMDEPRLFKRISLLYFAAASYAEAARRLGRPELAPGFLLCGHPRFAPVLRAVAEAGRPETAAARDRLFAMIDRAIEPFDIAGLLDESRRDWYPVCAGDLLNGTSKLLASEGEIRQLLERCGMAPAAARPASQAAPR